MAEVLVDFDIRLTGTDRRTYEPQACGRGRSDGLWEGWLEFVPADGAPIRTARETTQPNRDDLMYWAQGLTAAYLEGALERVLTDKPHVPPHREPSRPAAFDEPAPARRGRGPPGRPAPESPNAVLDPFHVYAEGGIGMLRGQLDALSDSQLRNIVRLHVPAGIAPSLLDSLPRPDLTDLIVGAVEQRTG